MTNMVNLANEISAWLKNYAINAGRPAFVIGVSGGVDSALVSTLCAMTGLPTHCVVLPCQSKDNETDRGIKHIDWLQDNFIHVAYHEIDLTRVFETLKTEIHPEYDNDLAYANDKSRFRMIALYHIATCVGGLVVGTGNKVEDYNLFFYTKGGDGQVDIAPIGDLMKSEVRLMCRELGVLPELSEAVPTDGLWADGRTDESQLGASYEEFEWVVAFLEKNNGWPLQETIDNHMSPRQQEVLGIYNKWHTAGKHKSLPIPTFKRTWTNLKN